MTKKRVAIFVSFSGQGGVERMITHLAQGMIDAGVDVDMVLIKAKGEHLKAIPEQARIIRLNSKHTFTSLFELVKYLKNDCPDALLAVKHRAIKTAVLARKLAKVNIPLAGRLGTTVSAALEGRSRFKKWTWYHSMRKAYHQVDTIIPVSRGVADDVRQITQLPDKQLKVVRNPVITPALHEKAAIKLDHPWFQEGQPPVILAAGRLTRQKDFPTLLRAFALAQKQRPCRLLILGEGGDREKLKQQAKQLGIEQDLAMPGFADNPYNYMAHAGVFVLSSRWEGSPNVLTEAMAIGCPVVATDCPSGPVELLDGGRIAPLVKMGNEEMMADAIVQVLDQPGDKQQLKEAVSEYNRDTSARAYLKILAIPL